MDFSFFTHDQEQALRIKRFLMALGSYFLWAFLYSICILKGFTRFKFREVLVLGGIFMVINGFVYGTLRSGLNKRFKDPSLTMFQMIMATFGIMSCLYGAGEIRGSLLMLFLVVFIFGMFRLKFLEFMFLSAFALLNYGIVVYCLYRFHPEEVNIQEELVNLLILATVLPWFSMIASYITGLRRTIAKALETIEKLAVTDELTQVYNRRRLLEILKEQKAFCDRGNKTFAICIFDLDHFKKVNDTFGHEKGDIVLKKVASVIRKNIRDIDCIARYGGEEFMLVLSGASEIDALMLAERIREKTEQIRYENMDNFSVTISIGVAVYMPQENFQTTINRADTALYRAKANGRNRVEIERKVESKQLYLFST